MLSPCNWWRRDLILLNCATAKLCEIGVVSSSLLSSCHLVWYARVNPRRYSFLNCSCQPALTNNIIINFAPMSGHESGSTQTLPSGRDHGSFDAKRCLETVKSYGSGLTTKAEAILALHNTILQTGSVLGTSDGDPFPTYVQMLDEIDFASKSKAIVKRARQGYAQHSGRLFHRL